MCYDMSFFSSLKLITDFLNSSEIPELDFEPTFHKVAQSFCRWPVALYEEGIKVKLFEWGLIADYMNTPEKIKQYRSSMANARSEKIINDKKSVWYHLRKQRCLVFTTGFFEHREVGRKRKLPYFIKVKNQEIFCFAGLYNYSPLPDPETGEVIGTFTIITRPANDLMAKIHNNGPHDQRMPLLLTKALALQWISPSLSDTAIAEILSFEFSASEMEAWPVNSIRIRKEDGSAIIEKLTDETIPPL
jgi:putative SOS response-associated peptidase YedK